MKCVALISGGKDSCHAMYLAQQHGHEIVALANLLPKPLGSDDLNSYMYQTVGWQLIDQYATCMNLPLYRKYIHGSSAKQDLSYSHTEGDEVEDLYILLSYVKDSIPGLGAVTSGAIASDYQRLRVEHVCSRLNLVSLAYLWHQPQRQLLRCMIESGLKAVLVKVAALGLDPDKHLGKDLATVEPLLLRLNDMYGSHVCGEGGEYETLTLDHPLFTHGRIVIDATEVVIESRDGVTSVGYLRPTAFHVETKTVSLTAPDLTLGSPRPVPDYRRTSTSISWDGGGSGGGAHAAGLPLSSPKLSRITSWSRGHFNPAFPSVHMVPDEYLPSSPVSRDMSRQSVERKPNLCEVHTRTRHQGEYMQVTLWAVLNSHKQALSSDVTENDTAVALMDLITALHQKLREAGLHMDNVLYVHLLLSTMGHFSAANNLYCKNFPQVDPPSRTCVQLPLPPGVPLLMDVLVARHAYKSPTPTATTYLPMIHTHHSHGSQHTSSSPRPSPLSQSPHGFAADHAAHVYTAAPSGKDDFMRVSHSAGGSGNLSHTHSNISNHSTGHTHGHNGIVLPGNGSGSFGAGSAHGVAAEGLVAGADQDLSGEIKGVGAGPTQKRVLHVQSISSWAPSCIGPYSQAILYDGLIYGAGCIPLQPHSMTVLPGCDPVSQTLYCLQHIGSVATALRTDVVKATVGMTVYYCASIGAKGLEAIIKTIVDVRTHGMPASAKTTKVRRKQTGPDGLVLSDEDDNSADDMEVEEDDHTLDPYLRPPAIKNSVKSNTVFVAVPALPRGCLVEIQPLLLDCQWLEANCVLPDSSSSSCDTNVQPADGTTPTSPTSTDTSAPGPCHGGSTHTSPRPKPQGTALDAAVATCSDCTTRKSSIGLDKPAAAGVAAATPCVAREIYAHPLSPGCSRASSASLQVDGGGGSGGASNAVGGSTAGDASKGVAALTTAFNGVRIGSRLAHNAGHADGPAGAVASDSIAAAAGASPSRPGKASHTLLEQIGHTNAHQGCTLTPDSCQTSLGDSLGAELPSPTRDAAAAGAAEAAPGAPQDATATGVQGAAQGPQDGSGDVMVTTVHCRVYKVLKALFHLPDQVFGRPQVNKRLQQAVNGLLGAYGLQPEHVVQIRAWYDINKVREESAAELFSDCVAGWHVNWMPVMHVCTTVCEGGTAAVLEILAKPL